LTGPEYEQETAIASGNGAHPTGSGSSLESIEKNHILQVLKQTQGVIEGPRGAAKILNLHPNTLRSRMKKLGIERSSASA
jgi:transcriptional regulator with GAF, ATPase, and Fis domain